MVSVKKDGFQDSKEVAVLIRGRFMKFSVRRANLTMSWRGAQLGKMYKITVILGMHFDREMVQNVCKRGVNALPSALPLHLLT